MPPQLVALTEGPDLLLDKPILLLGRHQECDIQLSSRKISRRHCCIAQVNDHLIIRDLCSTNGIRINGVRVLEGNLK
jgi:pSer/pThr/pTyr-binding forkhead associated (FHA) protein